MSIDQPDGPAPRLGDYARRTRDAALWSIAGTALQFTLTAVTLVLSSRLVLPAAFGGYAAALGIVIIFQHILRSVIAQYVIQQKADGARRHALLGRALALSVVVALAGWYWADGLARLVNVDEAAPALRILWLSSIFVALGSVGDARLQERLAFRRLTILQVVSTALYAVVTIVWAVVSPGVVALAAGQGVQLASLGLLTWLFGPRDEAGLDRDRGSPAEPLPGHLPFNHIWWQTSVTSLCMIATQQVDNQITGVRRGATDLGLYSRAYRIASLPANLFASAITIVLFPALANRQSSLPSLRRVLFLGLLAIALVSVPASVLAVWDAHDVVLVTLGSDWVAGASAAAFLFAALPLRLSLKVCGSLLQSRGHLARLTTSAVLHFGLVAAGALVGSSYGVTGVGAGVCAGNAVAAMVLYHLLGSLRPTRRETLSLAAVAVSLVGLTVGLRLAMSPLGLSGLPLLLLDGAIALVLGAAPLLLLPGVNLLRDERLEIRSLLSRRTDEPDSPPGGADRRRRR